MKVSLLFPPSWLPSQPYLSLPTLTAFLRKHGVEVIQRDINIEFLETLMSWEKVKGIYSKIEDGVKIIERKGRTKEAGEKYARIKQALEWLPNLVEWIENAKRVLRTKEFYSLERYMESLKVMERWIELITSYYYPSLITPMHNEMKYYVYSSEEILAAIRDREENVFFDIFNDHIIPSILADSPDLVGISITSTSQVIPGLTLAYLIKNKRSDIHITVGGSVFTKLVDNLERNENLFAIVDSFVVFEGEHALLALIDELSGKKDLRKVPNLVYRENGKTVVNESIVVEDLNTLPTPDYDGLPLELYYTPELVLPVQTSRGCYWRKCAFCNLHMDHRIFRPRKVDLVVEDIQKLSKKYNTNNFFVTDESMPLSTMSRLSDRIIEQDIDIKWTCGVRFEKSLNSGLIERASQAGCLKMVFGMESYSQRVLDLMRKGTEREHINRVLQDCMKSDIAIHLYIIVGFPTETKEEVMETVNFILSNKRLLSSYGFSCLPCLFDLEKGSPIMDSPERFGLTSIRVPAHHDLSLGYVFEVSKGMAPEEAEKVYVDVMERINREVNPVPFNYSMSDGLLYLAQQLKEVA